MDPTLAKYVLTIGCMLTAFLMFWLRGRTRYFVFIALTTIILYRAALFYVMYIHFNIVVPADVIYGYIPYAHNVMNGLVAYRDFDICYGPFFPYINAGLLWLWNSDKVFPLASGIMEVLTILIFIALSKKKNEDYTDALILYSSCLIPLWSSIVLGANNSWLAMCLALAWLTNESKFSLSSGFFMAVGLLAVKSIGIFFVPFLFARSKSKILWMTGFIFPNLIVYGGLLALGANPLPNLLFEAGGISSGNLSYLLGIFGSRIHSISGIICIGLAAVLITALSLYALFRPLDYKATLAISSLAFVVFMALWPKSYATYLSICMFPLCLLERVRWVTLISFGLLGLVGGLDVALFVTMGKCHPLYMLDVNTRIVLLSTCSLLLAGYFVFIFRQAISLFGNSILRSTLRTAPLTLK